MENLSPVIFVAVFVVIVCIAVLEASRQTMSQRLECPCDGEERDVVFEASSMEPEHWRRVVACCRPGGPVDGCPACRRECQRTACHARTPWAPGPVLKSRG